MGIRHELMKCYTHPHTHTYTHTRTDALGHPLGVGQPLGAFCFGGCDGGKHLASAVDNGLVLAMF